MKTCKVTQNIRIYVPHYFNTTKHFQRAFKNDAKREKEAYTQ